MCSAILSDKNDSFDKKSTTDFNNLITEFNKKLVEFWDEWINDFGCEANLRTMITISEVKIKKQKKEKKKEKDNIILETNTKKSNAQEVVDANRKLRVETVFKGSKEEVDEQQESREKFVEDKVLQKKKDNRDTKLKKFRDQNEEEENIDKPKKEKKEKKEKKAKTEKIVKEFDPNVKPKNEKQVNSRLEELGVKDLDKVSRCLRASILKGHVKLISLETEIKKFKCEGCNNDLSCTINDVL